jgi:hypothetical protein
VPKELRLAGITTIAAANAWLKDHYRAEHNRQFAIAPEEDGTAFVPDREGAWRDILCVIEERVVGNDNTVAWNGGEPPASALRARQGQGARVSRWGDRDRSWAASAGAVRH